MSDLIPRLSTLAQLPPDLADHLRPRVERLGYLGEFFQCSAHQPRALLEFMQFTDELKAALPDKLSEVVAISVSCLMKNAYERVQHERLSLKLGFGEEWVRTVRALAPEDAGAMSHVERAVQSLVIAVVTRNGHDVRPELDAVITALGHAQAIAILMLVGRYMTHALMVNALSLQPPVQSPLEEP
jgi:carboxymuconolactone decarboxylase family protein